MLTPAIACADFPGGILETPDATTTRSRLSHSEILKLLPERGKFTFPAPYNTEAVRLTNASDCNGGDCVNYVGYSYWRNINNHVGQSTMLFFLGMEKSRGGSGPTLFEYNKSTDAVNNLGPLFNSSSPYNAASAEGWYFSATMPTKLYMFSGGKILRHDVMTKQQQTVLDINDELGGGHTLWQLSSSDDDRVHAATVRDATTYDMLGCMAYNEASDNFQYFPGQGAYDECQIDKSGKWLVIKENVDGAQGEDNRIINLETGHERILLDGDGAAGHSDMGYGYMIAADNYANDANTQKLWDFESSTLQGELAYHNNDWSAAAPAHVSHTNAKPGAPENQFACGSSANTSNSPHANEIVCFQLDGSEKTLVVAPVMTDLNSRGGGTYVNSPKGNLDVTGQYFIWTSNMGGDRLDAFLVKVPSQRLGDTVSSVVDNTADDVADIVDDTTDTIDDILGGGSASGSGGDSTSGTNGVVDVSWTDLVNVTANGSTLKKTAGCDGCQDAGAASTQQISNGYLEFTAPVESRLRSIGLSSGHAGTDESEIDFALRLSGDYAVVREHGSYKTETAYSVGDVFRISANNGQVSYARNGTVFYTSDASASGSLRADTTFFSMDGAIASARISDAAAAPAGAESGVPSSDGSSVPTPSTPTPTPSTPSTGGSGTPTPSSPSTGGSTDSGSSAVSGGGPVTWDDLINVSLDGSVLKKTSGCGGCADAGAVSVERIDGGSGYLEFVATVESRLRTAGLTSDHRTNSEAEIDYALRLQGNTLAVREKGQYRYDAEFQDGDVLRIAVADDGKVRYLRNGVVIYTSSSAASYPLRADTAFYSINASIKEAILGHGDTELSSDYSDNGKTPDFTAPQPEVATGISNVSVSGLGTSEASINWSTDVAVQHRVDYGSSVAYGQFGTVNTTYKTSHGTTLSGLAPNTEYHYRILVRNRDGLISASKDFTFTTKEGTLGPQPVNWTDRANTGLSGTTLSKTGGCNGCPDAGAASVQQIAGSSDGYLEFVVDSTANQLRLIGLGKGHSGTAAEEVDYALNFRGNVAEVREQGGYRTEIAFQAGDVFRIAKVQGRVSYARNGKVFHSSASTTSQALRADTTFYATGGAFSDAIISTGATALEKDAVSGKDKVGPSVNGVSVSNLGTSSATLHWNSNELAQDRVDYGPNVAYYQHSPIDTSFNTSHSMNLTGLKRNTVYHYRILTRDQAGNITSSEDLTFKTR